MIIAEKKSVDAHQTEIVKADDNGYAFVFAGGKHRWRHHKKCIVEMSDIRFEIADQAADFIVRIAGKTQRGRVRDAGNKIRFDFVIAALVAVNFVAEAFEHFRLGTEHQVFPAGLLIKIMPDKNFHALGINFFLSTGDSPLWITGDVPYGSNLFLSSSTQASSNPIH